MKLFFYVSVLLLFVLSCQPTQARAPARAAALSLAHAIRISAVACTAKVTDLDTKGEHRKAVEIGAQCEGLLLKAQTATIASAKAVDDWTDGKDFSCKVQASIDALEGVSDLLGVGSPPALLDALSVGRSFVGGCK